MMTTLSGSLHARRQLHDDNARLALLSYLLSAQVLH